MPSLNILVTHKLTEQQVASICEVDDNVKVTQCKSADTANYIENTDILICWGSLHLQELLPKAPRLKWIHTLSAGIDGILTPDLVRSNIVLTNSRGIHGIPMAEHVLGIILGFTRGLLIAHDNQKNHIWERPHVEEIYDKSIAIIGLGSIGREIAKRAKALGMKVSAVKQTLTTELFVDKLYTADQLPQVLSLADFIVVTLPLTPETYQLFSLELFCKMKKNAYFINVARGAIVKEADLITALNDNIIRGAALDVFAEEPLPPDSPLWTAPNLFISPHIAAKSPYYMDRSLKLFMENLSKFLQNAEMLNVINKERGY